MGIQELANEINSTAHTIGSARAVQHPRPVGNGQPGNLKNEALTQRMRPARQRQATPRVGSAAKDEPSPAIVERRSVNKLHIIGFRTRAVRHKRTVAQMMDEVLLAIAPAVATGGLALALRVLWGLTTGKARNEIRVTVEGPSGRRDVVLDGLKDDPSTRDAVRNLVGQLVDLQDSPVKDSEEYRLAQQAREAELKELAALTRENGEGPA